MHKKGWILVVVVLSSVIVALIAGILARLGGGTYVGAVQSGGASFGAALTLGILITTALGAL
ncbi:hypothetical protein SAMN05216251_117150 [Actinacidiphila alni]|uniref:Uncharacterized protein n=1 Tax=Actinacidiphila alni TaxID=380248 RepID=A0A1I2JFR2_9ACTN|nr:hypothetical protein [Actinacidiphila alni]SFF52703.1 hypothetical protein SAMN05216251_117150 [Actinacidiphila alni]